MPPSEVRKFDDAIDWLTCNGPDCPKPKDMSSHMAEVVDLCLNGLRSQEKTMLTERQSGANEKQASSSGSIPAAGGVVVRGPAAQAAAIAVGGAGPSGINGSATG